MSDARETSPADQDDQQAQPTRLDQPDDADPTDPPDPTEPPDEPTDDKADEIDEARPPAPLSTIILTLAGAVVVLAGMMTLQSVLAPVLLALFMMIVFRPLGAWLERVGIPKPLVMLVNMIVVYGVLIFLGWCIYLSVAQFAVIVAEQSSQLTALWTTLSDWLQTLGVQTNDINSLINFISPARIAAVAQQLLASSASLVTTLSLLAALVFFMSLDASNFNQRLDVALRHRPSMSKALRDFGKTTRSYFAVAATFGAIVAVLDWLVLIWLGVPDAWLWALLAFVTNFIPNIGFLIGLIPPALIALLVNDWQSAVLVIVGYTVINVVVQTLIQPAVVGDRVQLNTTLSFTSLIVWTFLLGGLGSILAVPITLLLRALFIDSRPELRWVRSLISSGGGAKRHRTSKKVAKQNEPVPAPPEPKGQHDDGALPQPQ